MRTDIPDDLRAEASVRDAEAALRTCVHCGFCNATCPTYLLTGNELEGPRGRIYLMKSVLEGRVAPSSATLDHIDNCLGCLACETTCPSGVLYSRLLDDARPRLEKMRRRGLIDRLQRGLITRLLPHPGRFRLALQMARWARPPRRACCRGGSGIWPPWRRGGCRCRPELAVPGVHPAQGAGAPARGPAHRLRPVGPRDRRSTTPPCAC